MGKTYLFECDKCGYRATVAGGAAAGDDVRVQTAFCRDCRTLVDCVTAMRVNRSGLMTKQTFSNQSIRSPYQRPPTLAAALNRLPPTPGVRRVWLRFKLECPVNSTHRIEPWKHPGRCPRCRSYMEQNALPYRVWD